MKNLHVEVDRWYYGIPKGGSQEVCVYVTSNSRSEGSKGYYVKASGGVGYGVVAVNPYREPNTPDDTELLEANYALSRVNNEFCNAIAAKYFKEEIGKQKLEREALLSRDKPSKTLKVFAWIVVAAIVTFVASVLFL